MRTQRKLGTTLAVICLLLLACGLAQAKSKYLCDEAQPASMCSAANTCGSPSAPCTIDIAKAGQSSNVKPGIPNAKNNQFFCVKKGTTVVWITSNKNTGFMISFGTDSPFDPDDPITGGASLSPSGGAWICHLSQVTVSKYRLREQSQSEASVIR